MWLRVIRVIGELNLWAREGLASVNSKSLAKDLVSNSWLCVKLTGVWMFKFTLPTTNQPLFDGLCSFKAMRKTYCLESKGSMVLIVYTLLVALLIPVSSGVLRKTVLSSKWVSFGEPNLKLRIDYETWFPNQGGYLKTPPGKLNLQSTCISDSNLGNVGYITECGRRLQTVLAKASTNCNGVPPFPRGNFCFQLSKRLGISRESKWIHGLRLTWDKLRSIRNMLFIVLFLFMQECSVYWVRVQKRGSFRFLAGYSTYPLRELVACYGCQQTVQSLKSGNPLKGLLQGFVCSGGKNLKYIRKTTRGLELTTPNLKEFDYDIYCGLQDFRRFLRFLI